MSAAKTPPGKAGVRTAARKSLPCSQPTGKIAQCARGLAALATNASNLNRLKARNMTSDQIPNLIEVIPVVWRLLTCQAFVLEAIPLAGFLSWCCCCRRLLLCQKLMLRVRSIFMLRAYSLRSSPVPNKARSTLGRPLALPHTAAGCEERSFE